MEIDDVRILRIVCIIFISKLLQFILIHYSECNTPLYLTFSLCHPVIFIFLFLFHWCKMSVCFWWQKCNPKIGWKIAKRKTESFSAVIQLPDARERLIHFFFPPQYLQNSLSGVYWEDRESAVHQLFGFSTASLFPPRPFFLKHDYITLINFHQKVASSVWPDNYYFEALTWLLFSKWIFQESVAFRRGW